MRTTVTLDDDVAAKVKAICRKTGESFKRALNRLLRTGLVEGTRPKPKPPFRVEARDLGLKPGVRFDDVAGLLERLDGPEHP